METFLFLVGLFLNFHIMYGNPTHEIKYLPGLYINPTFKQYSGYLMAAPNLRFHYWFVESQTNPLFDPVVIWLNGGPGCSSLFGLLAEHGPLQLTPDMKLKANDYAWNRISNVLYIEAPVGTGFSYATDKKRETSDDSTAKEIYHALLDFMANYPRFRLNSVYVTGESYAGIYISILCKFLTNDTTINLKGLMVGNGYVDSTLNAESMFYYQKYHGLISENLWNKSITACCPNRTTVICHFFSGRTSACGKQIRKLMKNENGINIYNLYKPCYGGINLLSASLNDIYLPDANLMSDINLKSKEYAPCINNEILEKYLNQPLVRESIQVPNFVPQWTMCNDDVFLQHKQQYRTTASAYKFLVNKQKYRIWFYNGDLDMACNYLGQQWFLDSLGYPVEKEYSKWTYTGKFNQQQLGGFYMKYSPNITYIIVSGAGHMVPVDKPLQAFLVFQAFIQGNRF